MSTSSLPANDLHLPVPSCDWIGRLPDGAVSIETDGTHWVLRASHPLQSKFEELLERRKAGQLTAEETREYDAICDLDRNLSWLNRLIRGAATSRGADDVLDAQLAESAQGSDWLSPEMDIYDHYDEHR